MPVCLSASDYDKLWQCGSSFRRKEHSHGGVTVRSHFSPAHPRPFSRGDSTLFSIKDHRFLGAPSNFLFGVAFFLLTWLAQDRELAFVRKHFSTHFVGKSFAIFSLGLLHSRDSDRRGPAFQIYSRKYFTFPFGFDPWAEPRRSRPEARDFVTHFVLVGFRISDQ